MRASSGWLSIASLYVVVGVLLGTAREATAVAQQRDVVVFAAASLKNALDDVNRAWEKDTGKAAIIVYAASNALAKQIEAGAPADIFVSADIDWMDYAASKKLIRPQERVNLLGNSLVLIGPKGSAAMAAKEPDITLRLGDGHLAMGNVAAVPAGKYGKAALAHLGQWEKVKGRVAQAESVRAALLLVSRGEAPLGIVYRTDAASDPNVEIVFTFPSDSYPPIVYPAALTAESRSTEAAEYLSFLRSDKAKPLFERNGFSFINKLASDP